VASSWILFFNYQDDALSNTHQICCEYVNVPWGSLQQAGNFMTI